MIMRVEMNMDMGICSVNMAMRMQKFSDDMAVFLIHVLLGEYAMQQFMRHQGQWHFQFVLFQQLAIIENLA
jgi:hypothetical protein